MNNEPEKRRCDYCRIAEAEVEDIREERDKWREAAVAYQKWRNAYFKWEPDELVEHPQVHLDLEAAQDRLEAATAALGDEWDEAIEEKRHG